MLCVQEWRHAKSKKTTVKEAIKFDNYDGARYDSGFAETRAYLATVHELQGLQLEALKKQIGSLKNLNSYTEVKTTFKDSVKTYLKDSVLFDTIRVQIFNYADKYSQIKGIVSGDSIQVEYKVDAPLTVTFYRKRETKWKFWQKKKTFCVVESPNKRIQFDSLRVVMSK
jgi:hypothetical protein